MCTGFSTFGALLRGSALALSVVIPLSAEPTTEQTRPRTLTDSTEHIAEQTNIAVGSSEAKAEAKRVYKIGVEYGKAGLFTQALELFKRAIRLRPDYADAYRSLGHAYLDLKDLNNAVQSFERALELNPKDKEASQLLDMTRSMLESNKTPGGATNVTIPSTSTAAETELSLTKIYRVEPGDVLDVRLSDSPSTSSTLFTITKGGLLEHPGLSQALQVSGLTVDEITAKLESALQQRIPNQNIKVSIDVHEYVTHVIMVSGLVKEPGPKILQREAIPLSVVVADAQPLPEAQKAFVVRSKTGETFTLDLMSSEINFFVRPGDVITLQPKPTEFFYVSGEVKTPGEKVWRRGLTLTQAIITAGGSVGSPREARLARDDGKGFLEVTRYQLRDIESGKAQDPSVQPGDRITVLN
ncbi:MAG TPA: tetratricopeptide repeat protein [Pyrinomonadaceae bacterium]|nr:tetratricopeptide repeat protein [Pyrinomonadaceae bacterium]